jgi:uncharacterized membrane protein YccC
MKRWHQVPGATAVRDELRQIGGLFCALGRDLSELGFDDPRARQSTIAAFSVMLSVTIAQWLHFDEVWWAGISGFISSQATRPASIERGVLRVAGTAVGAALTLAMIGWLAYDHVACCLVLGLSATVAVLGAMVSPHGYAWLFAGITANLVLLMSLNDPSAALGFAFYRTLEVTVGTLAAVLLSLALAADDPPSATAAPSPGWSDLLGVRWPAVLHAVRCGVAVAVLPLVWSWLELPSQSQMAVTVAAVMAVPVLSADPLHAGRIVARRAVQRVLGCGLGGAVGLACLYLSPGSYPPWLVMVLVGVWIGTFVQGSQRGVGYIGTQGTVVFIMTLIHGWGPPDSLMAGIDRFAGITLGLVILLIVSLLIWPSKETAAAAPPVVQAP